MSRKFQLVLGPEYDGECDWNAFAAWVKTLSVDGCADFVIPSKLDGMLLWTNLRKEFKEAYYWLAQHAEDSAYAWYQSFYGGGQHWHGKDGKFRARSVRRILLSDFSI